MVVFKCIKFKHPIVQALMFFAWPWESCPNWMHLHVESVRVQNNTRDYVFVKIGK